LIRLVAGRAPSRVYPTCSTATGRGLDEGVCVDFALSSLGGHHVVARAKQDEECGDDQHAERPTDRPAYGEQPAGRLLRQGQ